MIGTRAAIGVIHQNAMLTNVHCIIRYLRDVNLSSRGHVVRSTRIHRIKIASLCWPVLTLGTWTLNGKGWGEFDYISLLFHVSQSVSQSLCKCIDYRIG